MALIEPGWLPYPIARPYAESRRTDVAVSNQLDNTFATYSALLRFVALTLVSQFLNSDLDPDHPEAMRAAKAVASLRQPTLESWYAAINAICGVIVRMKLGEAEYDAGGPFSPALLRAATEARKAKEGAESLHNAIRNLRNQEIGHHEGRNEAHRAEVLRGVRPWVARALEIYAPALRGMTLLRRDAEGTARRLAGPGPEFLTEKADDSLAAHLEVSPLVLRRGAGGTATYLELFPLLIHWEGVELQAQGQDQAPGAGSADDPVRSFDGHGMVLQPSPGGRADSVHVVKYRGFHGSTYSEADWKHLFALLERKKISPHFNRETFQPWSVAEWAASETRLQLAYQRSA